ncbi:MAG: hypothetical protein IT204_20265 [Fimbriimonadaceae bacterium]|nr:hypothetical protein [Fimbriimonadaceae bacterium]
MTDRDRRAALRAVQAAASDAAGKLGPAEQLPPPAEPTLTLAPRDTAPLLALSEPAPALVEPPPPAAEPAAAPPEQPSESVTPVAPEELLPATWRERIDAAAEAERVEVGGETVRRKVEEEWVYLAVRVPRSLRDAVRRRADRLEVSMQEFVVSASNLLLQATARAAERD